MTPGRAGGSWTGVASAIVDGVMAVPTAGVVVRCMRTVALLPQTRQSQGSATPIATRTPPQSGHFCGFGSVVSLPAMMRRRWKIQAPIARVNKS